MNQLINIIIILICVVIIFYLTRLIICKVKGISADEAEEFIKDFFDTESDYDLATDNSIYIDISNNIHNVIGDKRYDELCRINNSAIDAPLITTNNHSGVPYISVAVNPLDDNEKMRIETVVVNIIKRKLQEHKKSTNILKDWGMRSDIGMPYLEVRYSRNKKEEEIIKNASKMKAKTIIRAYNSVVDDIAEDDLND